MISAWHLVWIIPLSMFAGAAVATAIIALLVASGGDDKEG